jgi:hypothetical protein
MSTRSSTKGNVIGNLLNLSFKGMVKSIVTRAGSKVQGQNNTCLCKISIDPTKFLQDFCRTPQNSAENLCSPSKITLAHFGKKQGSTPHIF